MKVALALGWYYPDGRGGTEAYVAALAAFLGAAGHEVRVVAPEAGLAGVREYEHDGVRVWRYGVTARPTREQARGTIVAPGAEALHAWFARERPDIVHVHAFVTGLGLAEVRAARAAGARVFVTTHAARLGWLCERGTMLQHGVALCDGIAEPGKCAACVLPERGAPRAVAAAVASLPAAASAMARDLLPGRAATMIGMPALVRENLERQHALYETIEKFVVLTEWARRAVLANGAPRELVVLNRLGAVPPRGGLKPGPAAAPTEAPVLVGFIGRFDRVKGADVLVRAMVQLPRIVSLRVVLRGPVGTSAEQAVVDELRSIAGGDPRVAFEGEVPRAGIGDALRSIDVLCCPSRTVEGGPTIAIEAQSVGTPVIGSAIGGLAELVIDGLDGRLVPPDDVNALAEVLRAIAADPAGTVDRWRAELPQARTMDDVARDTLAMYAA